MTLTRFALAATLALTGGTAAMADNVHVRMLGDGNVACISGAHRVYISAQVRGDYNRLCVAALYNAGILTDVRGDFNDVDTAAIGGAIASTVIRGDGAIVTGTTRGTGSTSAVEVYGDGARVGYAVTGRNSHLHVVIRD